MPTVKLTPTFVRDAKCEPGVTRSVFWDTKTPRFGLQVTVAGSKSYVFQYRDPATRKQTRITYRFDGGLNEARKLAEDDAARLRLGKNPTVEKRKSTRGAAPDNSLEAVCREYLKREGGKLRSRRHIESTLERLVYPKLGARQIDSIKRSEIVALLDGIIDNSGPVAGHYALAVLRRILNWHALRSDDFVSPIVRGMTSIRPSERARARTLTDDELRAIWKESGDATGPFGPFLRFILLTACRRTEAAAMAYSELSNGDWVIPAARYKSKRDMVIPLSTAAQAVLSTLPRIDGVDYVFTTGNRPISGFSKFKKRFDEKCGVTGWTIHDLRRTARTLMTRAGVSAEHAERCLGHVVAGVEGVYNRHAYYDEKKRAFEMLAAQIDRILTPEGNVIPMRTEIPA